MAQLSLQVGAGPFDIHSNNCFYVGGPSGSGKSALFSAINIGLGGGGKSNDRGNSVKQYKWQKDNYQILVKEEDNYQILVKEDVKNIDKIRIGKNMETL